jgi:hypothetical protein
MQIMSSSSEFDGLSRNHAKNYIFHPVVFALNMIDLASLNFGNKVSFKDPVSLVGKSIQYLVNLKY